MLLNFVTQGNGTAVILIHGIAASLYDWETLMPQLGKAGYQAVAVDLLGHGDSPKPSDLQLYTRDNLYATLEAWIEHLGIQAPYILVGHSLGGHLCLSYALHHPQKVRSLVLIDPLYSPEQLSPVLRIFHRRPRLGVKALNAMPLRLAELLMGLDPTSIAHFTPQARRQIAIDLKRASPNILNIPRTIPDLSGDLTRIQSPSQVIWGENDLTLKPSTFSSLVSALSNATGHSIPKCGHQPHIGKPKLVNRLILDFLGSNGQR